MRGIGIRLGAGLRTHDLFEQEKVARYQIGHERLTFTRARSGKGIKVSVTSPLGEAAFEIPPGVQEDLVIDCGLTVSGKAVSKTRTWASAGSESKVCRRHIGLRNHHAGDGALDNAAVRNSAQDLGPQGTHRCCLPAWTRPTRCVRRAWDSPPDVRASRRSALACRIQVGFVRYGILKVTEIVAFEGEQFEERDPQVGGVALDPAGV